jgi:hypothetical protein
MIKLEIETYQKVVNWARLPSDVIEANFERTVTSASFPGAVLPSVAKDGRIQWYAIADDAPTWRKLRPLLNAYVGETVTTFNGEPSQLKTTDSIENIIIQSGAYAVAKLQSPSKKYEFPLRALTRMVHAIESKPKDLRPPPASTATMIARFDMCLTQGDRGRALTWLLRLKDEKRLDPLNLIFSEVRLFAAFRDWSSILNAPWFNEICRVGKPPIVAKHILEAIWHFDLSDTEDEPEALQIQFDNRWRDYSAALLSSIPYRSGYLVSKFVELLEGPPENDITAQELPNPVIPDAPDLTPPKEVEASDPKKQDLPGPVVVPDEEQNQTTLEKSVVDVTSSIDDVGWIHWLNTLKDPIARGVIDKAREIGDTIYASSYEDPVEINALSEALLETSDGIAYDRLVAALPTLLNWVKSDEAYPRKPMKPIYEALLTLISLLEDSGTADREAASELLSALLETGVNAKEYHNLLQDISHFIPEGSGTNDVYWLLDLADLVTQRAAMNEGERTSLLNRILGSLTPVAPMFTPIQSSAYLKVSEVGGWPVPVEPIDKTEILDVSNKLNGKLVAIYTLSERAGRNAAEALKRLAPKVKVEVSSAHDCSRQLQSLSQNADLFVITTSSAKHAATDCISQNRRTEDILFAAGKGQCSILRAVEEFLA